MITLNIGQSPHTMGRPPAHFGTASKLRIAYISKSLKKMSDNIFVSYENYMKLRYQGPRQYWFYWSKASLVHPHSA
jgi:hypothetical protein